MPTLLKTNIRTFPSAAYSSIRADSQPHFALSSGNISATCLISGFACPMVPAHKSTRHTVIVHTCANMFHTHASKTHTHTVHVCKKESRITYDYSYFILHHFSGKAFHFLFHSRAEHEKLPVRANIARDRPHLVLEPHLEHSVCFVQYQHSAAQ